MQFGSDVFKLILFLLDLLCFDFDVLFFLLQLLDIFQYGVVYLLPTIVLELQVCLILVNIYDFLLDFRLFLHILRRLLLLFKLISRDVN